MTSLRVRLEATRDGSIALVANPAVFTSTRPVTVMIHGALRDCRVLLDWGDLLASDTEVVFAELPGHGRSPPIFPASLEVFAANMLQAIQAALPGRDVIVVGESLGGLVALAMAGMSPDPIRAVLAAAPPLTTAKLWHVAASINGAIARNPESRFLKSLADEIFGLAPSANTDRIYYPLLERVRIPVHIATGDLPLLPPRSVKGLPCLLDDVDRFVLANLYSAQVKLHAIEDCGHLLLIDQRAQCLDLIRRIQRRAI